MTPLVKEVHKLTGAAVSRCMWFDVGMVSQYDGPLIPLRLPFDQCAVVCLDPAYGKHLFVFLRADDETVLGSHWTLAPMDWHRSDLFAITIHNKSITYRQVEGLAMPQESETHTVMGVLQSWLSRLQTHACDAYEPLPKQTFLNRIKAAEGKQPSYSWRTVVVTPMAHLQAACGGTHATPRLHERRGHWRNLANGRVVWVRDCLVGDPDKGVVEKDYLVATVH